MNSTTVKNKFQEAMDDYKSLFHEEADAGVKAMLSKIFIVSVNETNELCVDGINLDLNVRDCEEPISHVVSAELIEIKYSAEKKLRIDIAWAYNQPIPKIARITHLKETYSE